MKKFSTEMGTEVAETLAQVDTQAQCGNWPCSGSEIPPLAVVGQENGVRVSAEEEEGKVGVETEIVAEVSIDTDVVETEIVVEKGVAEGDSLLVEEANNIGEISDNKHENDEFENGDGDKEVKCLVDGDSAVLVGDGSGNKVELRHNEVSLVVDFHSGENCGNDGDKGSVAENGGAEEEKLTESQGTKGMMGEGDSIQEDTHNGEEDKDLEEDTDSEDGESNEEHDYCVGDFVWGKIRSHPWWPGRIYDPSDASVYARKHRKTKALLVAYFGDGSFSWCYPSQLKPFADGFDETSKQSNSKNFVNAVKEALYEIRSVAELKMICSCVPVKDGIEFAKPSVLNAGIKPGVLVPECDLSRLTGLDDGPAQLIATLRNVAESGRHTNVLELAVLKGWLSAFCKGGYGQAIYHEPLYIEGLEDKHRSVASNLTDSSAPVEVPFQGPSEEDWLSSTLRGGTGQSVLQRCLISEDKLYHRRQKSVADLMNEEVVVDPKGKKGKVHTTEDLTDSGKLVSVSVSGKRKMKSCELVDLSQDDNAPTSPSSRKKGKKKADTLETSEPRENAVLSNENGGDDLTSPSRRKRGRKDAEILETSKSKENTVPSTENGGSEGEEETKREKLSSIGDGDKNAKEESKGASASRERKKSKYLSPPFTNPTTALRKMSSKKKRNEAISEKTSKGPRMGERMTKVAGRLIGSTPTKNSDETQENQRGTPVEPSSHPPQENHMIVKNKSMKEIVTEVRAAALNPSFGLDSIDGKFIKAFRNSVYSDGSSYKECLEEEGEKSKSRKPELLEKDVIQTEPELLEPETPKATNDIINEVAKSRKKRTSRAGEASNVEKNGEVEPGRKKRKSSSSKPELLLLDKDVNQTVQASDDNSGHAKSVKRRRKQSGEASKANKSGEDISGGGPSPPSLMVSFPAAFALPTKDELISIFSKYGHLNEKETKVLYNSFSARIVFLKTSDAEEAYKTSAEKKHFGAAKVHYRLQYPPPSGSTANRKASPPKTETAAAASHGPAAAAEVPPLLFVKERLELVTGMLAKSEGNISPELKSKLEEEIGGLLEKVSGMVESTSS